MPYVYWAKCKIAGQVKSPKVVIMGGSASLFGIDGGVVKKETGMPVVNLALHAGLPARFYLTMADRYVGAGDVVVLPLELGHYGYEKSKIYSDLSLTYLLGIAPEFQRSLTPRQFIELYLRYGLSWLDRRLAAMGDSCFYLQDMECAYLKGQLIKAKGEELAHREYGLPHFDEYGDTIMPFGRSRAIPFSPCQNCISEEFLEVFEALRTLTTSRGATLIITYPTLFQCEDDPTLPKFVSRLSAMGVPVLGDPYLMSFPADYHYDTNYHLNAYGVGLYTSALAKVIRSKLKSAISVGNPECQIPLKAKCDGNPIAVKKPPSFSSRRWCAYLTLDRNGKPGKVCRKVLVNGKGVAYSEVEYSVKNVVKVLLPSRLGEAKILVVSESDGHPVVERILLECPDFVPPAGH